MLNLTLIQHFPWCLCSLLATDCKRIIARARLAATMGAPKHLGSSVDDRALASMYNDGLLESKFSKTELPPAVHRSASSLRNWWNRRPDTARNLQAFEKHVEENDGAWPPRQELPQPAIRVTAAMRKAVWKQTWVGLALSLGLSATHSPTHSLTRPVSACAQSQTCTATYQDGTIFRVAGEDVGCCTCFCCDSETIRPLHFETGHIIANAMGGSLALLLPRSTTH